MFWALIGPAIVFLSLATLVARHSSEVSRLDLFIGAVVTLILVARYVDIVRHGGLTMSGEPATLTHFRRFAATLVAVTASATLFAHKLAGTL